MANIKTHLNNIKNALFGNEVRGSIHDGIDAINKEVESTTGRQQHLEGTFEQLIINEGNSNAEIVAGRVKEDGTSFSTIGKRIADSEGKISVLENKISKNELHDCCVTFITDDAIKTDISIWLDKIFKPQGVVASGCVITSRVGTGNHMTWDQIRSLKAEGWTMCSHSHTHKRENADSYETYYNDCKESIRLLKANNLDYQYFCTPFSLDNYNTRKVTRELFDASFTGSTFRQNDENMKNHRIMRLEGLGEPGITLEQCKKDVDYAIDNNCWLVYVCHSTYYTQETVADMISLIEYIKSKNIDIVNIEEGFKRKGNKVDVGDSGLESTYNPRDKSQTQLMEDGRLFVNNLQVNKVAETKSSGSGEHSRYYKFATATLLSKDDTKKMKISVENYNNYVDDRAIVDIIVSQPYDMGTEPFISIQTSDEKSISNTDIFAIVSKNDSSETVVDFYLHCNKQHRAYAFKCENEVYWKRSIKLHNYGEWLTSLSGTKIVANPRNIFLSTISTPQGDKNRYCKLFSCKFTKSGQFAKLKFSIENYWNEADEKADIYISTGQPYDMGTEPFISIQMSNEKIIKNTDIFAIVSKNDSTGTVIDFYFTSIRQYRAYMMKKFDTTRFEYFNIDSNKRAWSETPPAGKYIYSDYVYDKRIIEERLVLLNNWSEVVPDMPVVVSKSYDTVSLEGYIVGGTNTNGTVICNLNEQYRPRRDLLLPITCLANGSFIATNLGVYADGRVVMLGLPTGATRVSLACSYNKRDYVVGN